MEQKDIDQLIETIAVGITSLKKTLDDLKPILDANILQGQRTEKAVDGLNPALDASLILQNRNALDAIAQWATFQKDLSGGFKALEQAVQGIKIPEAEKVDMGPVISGLAALKGSIESIKFEVPEQQVINFDPILNAISNLGEAIRKPKEDSEIDLSDLQNTIALMRDSIVEGVSSAVRGIKFELPEIKMPEMAPPAPPVWQGMSTLESKLDEVIAAINDLNLDVDTVNINVDDLEEGIGAPTDAEATGNGSVIAILKRLRTLVGNVDTNLGAKADAVATTNIGTFSLISLFKRLLNFASTERGTWGYRSGASGTVNNLPAGAKILQITAVALGAAGSLTIDGGDSIIVPYDATDKASTSITIEPKGNLVSPVIIFTDTDAYFIEYVIS